MSDTLSSIQKVGMDLANKQTETTSQETARAAAVEVKSAEAKAAQPQVAKDREPADAEKSRYGLPLREMSDVRLKYKVDPKTKELTVMMIDKKSHKVIRTIPPMELKDFNEGDLIELSS